jgi:hypothetical protein
VGPPLLCPALPHAYAKKLRQEMDEPNVVACAVMLLLAAVRRPHSPTSPRRHGDRRRAMEEGLAALLATPQAPHLFPISSLCSLPHRS